VSVMLFMENDIQVSWSGSEMPTKTIQITLLDSLGPTRQSSFWYDGIVAISTNCKVVAEGELRVVFKPDKAYIGVSAVEKAMDLGLDDDTLPNAIGAFVYSNWYEVQPVTNIARDIVPTELDNIVEGDDIESIKEALIFWENEIADQEGYTPEFVFRGFQDDRNILLREGGATMPRIAKEGMVSRVDQRFDREAELIAQGTTITIQADGEPKMLSVSQRKTDNGFEYEAHDVLTNEKIKVASVEQVKTLYALQSLIEQCFGLGKESAKVADLAQQALLNLYGLPEFKEKYKPLQADKVAETGYAHNILSQVYSDAELEKIIALRHNVDKDLALLKEIALYLRKEVYAQVAYMATKMTQQLHDSGVDVDEACKTVMDVYGAFDKMLDGDNPIGNKRVGIIEFGVRHYYVSVDRKAEYDGIIKNLEDSAQLVIRLVESGLAYDEIVTELEKANDGKPLPSSSRAIALLNNIFPEKKWSQMFRGGLANYQFIRTGESIGSISEGDKIVIKHKDLDVMKGVVKWIDEEANVVRVETEFVGAEDRGTMMHDFNYYEFMKKVDEKEIVKTAWGEGKHYKLTLSPVVPEGYGDLFATQEQNEEHFRYTTMRRYLDVNDLGSGPNYVYFSEKILPKIMRVLERDVAKGNVDSDSVLLEQVVGGGSEVAESWHGWDEIKGMGKIAMMKEADLRMAYFVNHIPVGGKYPICACMENRRGYTQHMTNSYDTLEEAEAEADRLNEEMGISKKDSMTIVLRSMGAGNRPIIDKPEAKYTVIIDDTGLRDSEMEMLHEFIGGQFGETPYGTIEGQVFEGKLESLIMALEKLVKAKKIGKDVILNSEEGEWKGLREIKKRFKVQTTLEREGAVGLGNVRFIIDWWGDDEDNDIDLADLIDMLDNAEVEYPDEEDIGECMVVRGEIIPDGSKIGELLHKLGLYEVSGKVQNDGVTAKYNGMGYNGLRTIREAYKSGNLEPQNILEREGKVVRTASRPIKRDWAVSMVRGRDLVGVYFADTDGCDTLVECHPNLADKIIERWNNGDYDEADAKTILQQWVSKKVVNPLNRIGGKIQVMVRKAGWVTGEPAEVVVETAFALWLESDEIRDIVADIVKINPGLKEQESRDDLERQVFDRIENMLHEEASKKLSGVREIGTDYDFDINKQEVGYIINEVVNTPPEGEEPKTVVEASGKRSCKYYETCGSPANCQACKGGYVKKEKRAEFGAYYSVWDNQCNTWLATGSNSDTREEAIRDAFEYIVSGSDDYNEADYAGFTLEDMENELSAYEYEVKRHVGRIKDNALGLAGEEEFGGRATKEVQLDAENILLRESSLSKESRSNYDVIEAFIANNFPEKDGWGTRHLYVMQERGGWALVNNYSTPIVFRRDSDGRMFFNTDKYSVTTSKIQTFIRRELEQAGATADLVDEEGIKMAISGEIDPANILLREGGGNRHIGCDCIACRLGLNAKAKTAGEKEEAITTTLDQLGPGDKFAFVTEPEKVFVLISKDDTVGYLVQREGGTKRIPLDPGVGKKQVFWWGGKDESASPMAEGGMGEGEAQQAENVQESAPEPEKEEAKKPEAVTTILKKLNNGDRFAFVKDPKKIFVFMSGEEGVGWIVNSGGPNTLLKSEVGDEQVFLWTGEETAPSGGAKQEQPTQKKEEPVEEEGWQTVGDMEIGDSFIEQGGKTRMTMIGIYPQYDFYFWVDADNQPHVSEIPRVKDIKVKKIGAYKVERAKELAKIHKDYLQALVQEKLGRQ